MSTTKQFLPADVARCIGEQNDLDNFIAQCEDCLRRTDRSTFPLQVWTAPPEFVDGKCELRMAP